ncbi:glucose-6-phosphate isomerase [Planctomycetota bacterium]
MPQSQIKLYYKNVLAEVIGDEHGITNKQWDDLAEKVGPLIPIIMEEIVGNKRHPDITPTRYGLLPGNTEIIQEVKDRVKEVRENGPCDNLVVLGIGGSALGNIALQTALNPYMYNLGEKQRRGPRLFVFDNVDPAQFDSFLRWADENDQLGKTLFNVISKSGQTAETASQLLIVRQKLLDRIGPEGFRNQVIATTDAQHGTLRAIADQAKLRTLKVPDDVGGRFSVLSAVGLFSAAMCGIEIDELLAGARDMHKQVSCENFKENPAAINAAIHYHYYHHGKKNSVIMPYAYALKDMADWYRQLWAESLGKSTDLNGNPVFIGPTPIKALGATDQHSQVQLYREGPNDKVFTFLQVENFGDNPEIEISPAPEGVAELDYLAGKKMSMLLNCEKQATEYALLNDERPCLTVLFDRVTPYTVGQFIYLFEVMTSFAGALFNIDTYNQPAVELGKQATFALMGMTGEYKPGCTYEQFAEKIRAKTNIDKDFLVGDRPDLT